MPRICPVSLKRRDIYGATMEQVRGIDILRWGCPRGIPGLPIRLAFRINSKNH
jgi:hypothetical protein